MKKKLIIFAIAKKVCLLLVLMLVGCSPKQDHTLMTLKTYQETHIGMSEDNLIKTFGYPNEMSVLDSGVKHLVYTERFQAGDTAASILEVRNYHFYIKEDKVVSKRMTFRNQPAWEIDSNDL